MREITYLEAVREALWQEMERDERVFIVGEDVGVYGGAFGVTRGMIEEFGEERIRDTPISEYGIAGAITGAALTGMVLCKYVLSFSGSIRPVIIEAARLDGSP